MDLEKNDGLILPFQTAEITNRTESQYIEIFSLNGKLLTGVEILDIAGGFSDFTDKVNEKFGSTGTHCRSIDPAYAILASLGEDVTVESFDAKVSENNDKTQGKFHSFGASDYRNDKVPFDLAGSDKALTARLKEMHSYRHRAAKDMHDPNASIETIINTVDNLPQIAGDALKLPIKTESMDLVLSSNFLLEPMNLDKDTGRIALDEALRVLKPNGELRIFPAPGFYTSKFFEEPGDSIYLINPGKTKLNPKGEIVHLPNYYTFDALLALERQEIYTYFVETDGAYILIIKKGPEIPKYFNADVTNLKKLNLNDSDREDVRIKFEVISVKK